MLLPYFLVFILLGSSYADFDWVINIMAVSLLTLKFIYLAMPNIKISDLDPYNIGIQMKRKELIKIFMMISNWKKGMFFSI